MSEQRLREFRSRAEDLVVLPDFEELDHRGIVRRRRRQALVVTVAAAAVAMVAVLSTTVGSPRAHEEQPADNPRLARATEFNGSSEGAELAAGTYVLQVSPYLDRPKVLVDLPPGWHEWVLGPNRPLSQDQRHGEGYVGLVVTDIYNVVDEPCQPADDGMKELGDEPEELVAAVAAMPRHRVLVGPEPDDRFGYPAMHLQVQVGHARCPYGAPFAVSSSTGLGEWLGAGDPGEVSDIWVVDVGSRPVLVSADLGRGSPRWLKAELDTVVDSIEFVPSD